MQVNFVYSIDMNSMTVMRFGIEGSKVQAHLEEGPDGFAQAFFPGEPTPFQSEVPNLLFSKHLPSPKPEKAVQKKPAAAVKPHSDKPEVPSSPKATSKYHVMWYKNSNSYGIRRKFGNHGQAFCVGNKSCQKTKEQLLVISNEAIKKIENAEMSEAEAKTWAKDQCMKDVQAIAA